MIGSVDGKGEVANQGTLTLLKQLRKGTGLAIYGCVTTGEVNEENLRLCQAREKQLD